MQISQSSHSNMNKESEREERRSSEPEEEPVTKQVEKAAPVSPSNPNSVPFPSSDSRL